jgi:hypothetical protein
MIERFLTKSEIKQTEFLIINNNICKTINNINDELRACKKNNELLNYNKNYEKNYKKRDIVKESNKKQEIKKEYNKDQNNKYNYNI